MSRRRTCRLLVLATIGIVLLLSLGLPIASDSGIIRGIGSIRSDPTGRIQASAFEFHEKGFVSRERVPELAPGAFTTYFFSVEEIESDSMPATVEVQAPSILIVRSVTRFDNRIARQLQCSPSGRALRCPAGLLQRAHPTEIQIR